MNVLREVDADLEILNQNLISGRTWDLFSSLQVKYSETLVWIREKHVVDGSKLQRDERVTRQEDRRNQEPLRLPQTLTLMTRSMNNLLRLYNKRLAS